MAITRLQAVKDAFRKAFAKSWAWGRSNSDQAYGTLAVELKEVFPPVTFGTGVVSGTDSVSQVGDLYCDRSTGQFYQYTPSGWAAMTGGGGGGYILPVASGSVLGGVKVGSGLAIDGSGVLSSSGGTLTVKDEGVSQGTADTLDFTGSGVTATVAAGVATINVPGGATPGGSTGSVQYNSGTGTLAGDSDLIWTPGSKTLQLNHAPVIALDSTAMYTSGSRIKFTGYRTDGGFAGDILIGTTAGSGNYGWFRITDFFNQNWFTAQQVLSGGTHGTNAQASYFIGGQSFWGDGSLDLPSGGILNLSRSSGQDAVKLLVNGARLHLGTGTLDYLYSDGVSIMIPGRMRSAGTYEYVAGSAGIPTSGQVLYLNNNGGFPKIDSVPAATRYGGILIDSGTTSGNPTWLQNGTGTGVGVYPHKWVRGSETNGVTPGAAANPSYEYITARDINATGTPDSTTYLRGDGTWATPAGGGGGGMGWLTGTATWDPVSLDPGSYATTTMTITGAAPGDSVAMGFSTALGTGMMLAGTVTAADTVTVTLMNLGGTTQDLASGTLYARVLQAATLSGSTTWDPPSMPPGSYLTQTVTVTGAVVGDSPIPSLGVALPTGMTLTAAVTAADTVTVTLCNFSGIAQDLASSTLTVRVFH